MIRESSGGRRRSGDVRGSRAARQPARPLAAVAQRRRRVGCCALALSVSLLLALALTSSPASARTIQRGHVFSFSFSEPGPAQGQLQHPAGVAVDNETGEVFVADRNDGRLEEFTPHYNGKGELIEEEYKGKCRVAYPEDVAVDNSASSPSKGDVYVVGSNKEGLESIKEEEPPEGFWVYKCKPGEEKPIAKLKEFKTKTPVVEEELEEIKGIAVDKSGDLLVSQDEKIYKFDDQEKNKGRRSAAEPHSNDGSRRNGARPRRRL